MLSDVCHPGHVQDASQGLPGLFSFNWVDQWMMTRLNGFNLGGSSQCGYYRHKLTGSESKLGLKQKIKKA